MENSGVRKNLIASSSWTNEKHVRFINSMESSFVQTMLRNKHSLVRLDRYLPDVSESTLDSKSQSQSRKQLNDSDILDNRIVKNGSTSRRNRRIRRLSHQPYDSSKDQVVPQIGKRRYENRAPSVPVASMPSNN